MNRRTRITLVAVLLIAAGMLGVVLLTLVTLPPLLCPRGELRVHGDFEWYYIVRAIISTINVALSSFLLVTYVGIYRKRRAEFTMALMIFAFVLLLIALASNPLFHGTFGFRAYGLGPFAMLPELFTCIALIMLVYLSLK